MACGLGASIEGEVTARNARILLTEPGSSGPEVHASSRHGLGVCGSGTATDHCLFWPQLSIPGGVIETEEPQQKGWRATRLQGILND